MAAVTSLVGYPGGTLLVANGSTTTTTLQSEPSKGWGWQITHTGLDEANAADISTVIVAFASGPTMTTAAAEQNKYVLVAGGPPLFVPPDVSSILYRSLAGAPVLSVCRSANFNGNF